jgi:general secretion pathway protein K
MVGELEDLQGRFNLNSLDAQPREGSGAARFTPEQALFIRMLQALETPTLSEYEAIAVTESIADWLDADEVPRLNGAESSTYAARTPAYRAANQPLRSVSELRAVANLTPALFVALEPLVTVWPQAPAAINLHTAPLPLLRAINADDTLQPLSLADGETLLQRRREPGYLDRDDFFSQPVFAEADVEGAAALFGESSSYFLLTARVEIADREQRLYSVLRRESRQVDVLLRMRAAL